MIPAKRSIAGAICFGDYSEEQLRQVAAILGLDTGQLIFQDVPPWWDRPVRDVRWSSSAQQNGLIQGNFVNKVYTLGDLYLLGLRNLGQLGKGSIQALKKGFRAETGIELPE